MNANLCETEREDQLVSPERDFSIDHGMCTWHQPEFEDLMLILIKLSCSNSIQIHSNNVCCSHFNLAAIFHSQTLRSLSFFGSLKINLSRFEIDSYNKLFFHK